MFIAMNLAGAVFLAYWYVIWPVPASWVALHSPGTLPQIRAFIRLGKTSEDYMYYQYYDDEGRDRFEQAARERNAEVQQLLVECLRSDDPELRDTAFELIGRVSGQVELLPELCDEIIRGTVDPDKERSYAAFSVVSCMPKEKAEPILKDMLDSSDEHLRDMAIYNMAVPGNRTVTRHLLPMLQDSEPSVRAYALDRLLVTGDPDAIPFVRALVKDGDLRVAGKAAEFLEKFDRE